MGQGNKEVMGNSASDMSLEDFVVLYLPPISIKDKQVNCNKHKGNLCDSTFEISVERLCIQFQGASVPTTSILLAKNAMNLTLTT